MNDEPYIEAALPGVEASPSISNLENDHEGLRADSPLFNARDPLVSYKREKWQHREVAFLACMGYNNLEIAERTGYTPVSVSNILRQPWIAELIKEEQTRKARSGIDIVLSEEEAVKSLQKIIDLRDTANSQEVQRKAANDHLNRMYGMPNQSITHTRQADLDALSGEELAKIVAKGRGN